MIKPHQVLAFGLAVFLPLLVLLIIYPERGIGVTDKFSIQFPTFDKVFHVRQDSSTNSAIDTVAIVDPAERQRILDSLDALRFRIQYPENAPTLLDSFYKALDRIADRREPLHILHFGGSQIEGDRITEHLRAFLQDRFGGNGPGWLPAVPYVGSRSYLIEHSENWERHALYGLVDSTVQHNHFGALGLYAQFTGESDSTGVDTSRFSGWLDYHSRYVADSHVRSFRRLTLFYGQNRFPVQIRLMGGDDLIHQDTLPATDQTEAYEYTLPGTRRDLTLEFTGQESPEVYAVSLEGTAGVMVSNISLRGQAGTHFWTQPVQQMKKMIGASDVRLIILQFGSNVVPYANTEEEISEYCYRFGKNIQYLQRMAPEANVLVIGPADMAVKEGTEWITYPNLLRVRDAMKRAVFANGAAYWDPLEAMGGPGTIQQWVLSDPPLAVGDHVHFTLDGAEKIARWFYDALIQDFEEFQSRVNVEEVLPAQ